MNEKKQRITENKMGVAPIWSLLLTMALPVILSTIVQSLYNIVDGIYVSRIGEDALAAMTFGNPIINILTAVGTGIAVGMNTMLSRGLGEKNKKHVDDAAKTAIFLGLVAAILCVIVAFTLIKPYLALQTDNKNIIDLGSSYLTVYVALGIGTIGQLMFERMLISTGKTMYSMISQGSGAVLNVILDPILIFGYFGFPAMGIKGAAYATVFSQIVATLIALYLNVKKNKEITIRFSLKPPIYAIKRVLYLGLPSALLLSLTGLMMFSFTAILNRFTSSAVAVFGACTRIISVFYSVVNALCSTVMPVIAYNLGARKKERVDQAIKYGYLYSAALMLVGTILCFGFPRQLLQMFSATEEMMSIGIWGMRAMSCMFILVGLKNTSTCIIQALGHSFHSMAIDVSRNYVIMLPMAFALSMTGVLNLVWIAVPIADIVSALIGLILVLYFYKKNIKTMEV
ncbi:MAG: MATE family efflux transporter [bacterium]|nr:MATE family efflux transporter [bacterium]